MKKSVPSQKTYIATIIALFIILLLGIYYISNGPVFKSLRGQQAETITPKIEMASPIPQNSEATTEAIDCSKRVAEDKKLLASDQKSDCLFIGCGDFFQ